MSEKLPSLPDEKMPLMPKNSNNNRVAKKKRIAKKPLASPLQLSTSQRHPLPLLPDLVELGEELRPLLRRCEKALNSQDNAHLSESFEEVNKKCEEVADKLNLIIIRFFSFLHCQMSRKAIMTFHRLTRKHWMRHINHLKIFVCKSAALCLTHMLRFFSPHF